MDSVRTRPLLYLIGYRGSGKTTVGRLVARATGRPFVDADVHLEARAGKSIRDIFRDEGEPAFRDLETATLRELSEWPTCVIATGGGIVMREENRKVLRARGFVVWLTAPIDVLADRIFRDPTTAERRPNLAVGGREEIAQLLRVREPIYRECANLEIDAAVRSPEKVAEAILSAWVPTGSKSSG